MNDTMEDVLRLLRDVMGSSVEILEAETVKQDEDYQVIIAGLRRPSLKVVIKLAGPGAVRISSFERTAAIHQMVANRTSIPMPTVIAANESYQKWPWRYFIKTYLAGEEWAAIRDQLSQEEVRSASAQIGQAVAELHAIRFSHFGEIDANGFVQTGRSYLESIQHRAKAAIRSPQMRDFFFMAFERRSGCFENLPPASLAHEDLHGHNILFKLVGGHWQLAAILDFEKAWAGTSEADLARMELWNMAGGGFWQIYNRHHPSNPLYPCRRPIYQLFWCLEYASLTPKHLGTTHQVCLELELPIIKQFEPFITKLG